MMEAPQPWNANASRERIEKWQRAVIEGRRRVVEIERRSTYPANPDPDTVAIAEHFQLKYPQARILKALSYSYAVPTDVLSELTGVHKAMIRMEVRNLARRTYLQIVVVAKSANVPALFKMLHESDCKRIRDVIAQSWALDGTFKPQSRVRMSA